LKISETLFITLIGAYVPFITDAFAAPRDAEPQTGATRGSDG
jgi:hypothetical protein